MPAVNAADIYQSLLDAYEPWTEQVTAAKKALFLARQKIRAIGPGGGTNSAEELEELNKYLEAQAQAQSELDELDASPWYDGLIEHQWEKPRESGSNVYVNTFFVMPDGKRVPTTVRGDAKQGEFIKPLDPTEAAEMSEKLKFKIWTRTFDGSLTVKRWLGPDAAEEVEVDGRPRRVPKDPEAMKAGGQSPLFVVLWLLDEANQHQIEQRIKKGLIIAKSEAAKLRAEAQQVGEDPNTVVSPAALEVPTTKISTSTDFCYSDKSHYGANSPLPNPHVRIQFKMEKNGELPSGPPRLFGKNKTPSCMYYDYDEYEKLVAEWEAAGGAGSGQPKPGLPLLKVDGQPITGMNIHRAVPRGSKCLVVAKKDAICMSNMSISSPCTASTVAVSRPAGGEGYGEIDLEEFAAEAAAIMGGNSASGATAAATAGTVASHLADLGLE